MSHRQHRRGSLTPDPVVLELHRDMRQKVEALGSQAEGSQEARALALLERIYQLPDA